MTPEQTRERAKEIAINLANTLRNGGAINACREIAADIAAIPIPPTPPDSSAEALKMAEEALRPFAEAWQKALDILEESGETKRKHGEIAKVNTTTKSFENAYAALAAIYKIKRGTDR